ncbi:MAG: hypothetical protein ACJAUG_001123 [Halioglobus sp.]
MRTLCIAYIDECPADAEAVFLCLHGKPTGNYLSLKIIHFLLTTAHRFTLPYWYAFGHSDTLTEDAVSTFDFHRNTLLRLGTRLDLQRIALIFLDRVTIMRLLLPMDMSDRYSTQLAAVYQIWLNGLEGMLNRFQRE